MSPIRLAGSLLGLLAGLWAAYVALVTLNTPTMCPVNGCPPDMFAYVQGQAVAGGALAVVSLVSLAGIRLTFVVGAALSAVVLVTLALAWGTYTTSDTTVALVLSAIALVVDVVASRPVRELSEKDSPLNLPVFG